MTDANLLKFSVLHPESVNFPADTNKDGFINEKNNIKYAGYFYDAEVGQNVFYSSKCSGQSSGSFAHQGGLNSKWRHDGYVDNLTDMQTLLGVKRSEKGMSTLGSSTRKNAISAGEAWVGENYNTITDNKGNILGYYREDGMRAFRIQYKPKESLWRANFQENVMVNNPYPNPGQHPSTLKNVHIDIIDIK